MEYDPETNTYTSHGPTARAKDSERMLKQLREQVKRLEERVTELENQVAATPPKSAAPTNRTTKW